jgi:hypothetical protein
MACDAGGSNGALPAARFRAACAAFAAEWDAAAADGSSGGGGVRGAWRWCDAPRPCWRTAADAAAPLQRGWLELREHLLPAATAPPLSLPAPAPAARAATAAAAQDVANADANAKHANDDDDEDDDPSALPAAAVAAPWHVYTLHIVHNASYGAFRALVRVRLTHVRSFFSFSRARARCLLGSLSWQACRSCCCAAPRVPGSPSRGRPCLLTWHISLMRAQMQQMMAQKMHLRMALHVVRWARGGRC